jgi:hypothetical protein
MSSPKQEIWIRFAGPVETMDRLLKGLELLVEKENSPKDEKLLKDLKTYVQECIFQNALEELTETLKEICDCAECDDELCAIKNQESAQKFNVH